jgi:hypothetical protein
MKKFAYTFLTSLLLPLSALGSDTGLTVQSYYSRRWYKLNSRGVQANEFGIAVLHPLGELPLSVGLNTRLQNHRNGDFTGADTWYGYELGAEGMAWVPDRIIRSRTYRPFFKYEFGLLSDHFAEGHFEGESFYRHFSGYAANFTLGINLNYSPEFRIILALVQGNSEWTLMKSRGRCNWSIAAGEKMTANSKAVMLAIETSY